MRLLIGITGASGSIYGIRLIEELKKNNIEIHLILSEEAEKIIEYETEYNLNQLDELISKKYKNNDLFAPPSSGSFKLDGMIISNPDENGEDDKVKFSVPNDKYEATLYLGNGGYLVE